MSVKPHKHKQLTQQLAGGRWNLPISLRLLSHAMFSAERRGFLGSTHLSSFGWSRRCRRSLTTDCCSRVFSESLPKKEKSSQTSVQNYQETAPSTPGSVLKLCSENSLPKSPTSCQTWARHSLWLSLIGISKETPIKEPPVSIWSCRCPPNFPPLGTNLAPPYLV